MRKKKSLAAVLNFFVPGLGHFYGRKARKGIITYLLFFVVVFSMRFIAYSFPLLLLSLALIMGYYVYIIVSAYRDVQEEKIYAPTPSDRFYVYALLFVFHCVLANVLIGRPLDRLTPINFVSIPTPSMNPTLQVGDHLAFKKTKTIERKDVIIFWFPDDVNVLYIMRCMGLPGDSLQIRNGVVRVNGNPVTDIEVKYKYRVATDGALISDRVWEQYALQEGDYMQMASGYYDVFLTEKQAGDFKALPFVKEIKQVIEQKGDYSGKVYPESEQLNWNMDFYGPVYIPKKGDLLPLTDKNIDLYLKCIAFENDSVERTASGLMINGQPMTDYRFKDNYCFTMGDSRHNSYDSRYWGFLPQKLVLGKAMYFYWGKADGRMGKEIH